MTLMTIFYSLSRLPNLHAVPRFWARILALGLGCPVAARGMENLARGQAFVFACNHSSAMDIPALQAVLPSNFRWMAKKELFEIPIFGAGLRACGYIPVDRSDHREAIKSLKEAAARIREGASVVIFPEGTRSTDGALLPFKKGGFRLATEAGAPLVPVAIVGAFKAWPAGTFDIFPHCAEVRFGDPIPTAGLGREELKSLPERVREQVRELMERDRD